MEAAYGTSETLGKEYSCRASLAGSGVNSVNGLVFPKVVGLMVVVGRIVAITEVIIIANIKIEKSTH